MIRRPVRVACIGAGTWGMNLVRQFATLPEADLVACSDKNPERLAVIRRDFPRVKVTDSYQTLLDDPEIEAVVVAVNAQWHCEIAMMALERGKHVFVEKPLALSAADAEQLVRLAERKERRLMVGHLMLYHPAVIKLKELIDSGELGDIYYLYTQRVNLGTIRHDESALWCFGPHDLSMMVYLLGEVPDRVQSFGRSFLRQEVPDVVFVGLTFPSGLVAQLQMSWLDPNKIRKLTVVGSRKMAVFDDMEPSEKLKIYDKGIHAVSYQSYGESLTLRFGDIHIPHIQPREPLRLECKHFLECVAGGDLPKTDGKHGLAIVQILEAAQASLDQGGVPVELAHV